MIYIVERITGAGYDCDDVGVFDTMQGAEAAVQAHCVENDLDFARYFKSRPQAGQYRLCFEVTNRPYYLKYIITPKEINVLTA